MTLYDLVIQGGRVIDPSQALDAIQDVGIKDGKIASLAKNIPDEQAKECLNATGLIVTPGLIDLHVHVYEGVSFFGVNADAACLHRGVTTVVDAGSSGAYTFAGLKKHIIEASRTHILAFLHLSGYGLLTRYGELTDLKHADLEAAFQVISDNRDVLCGIKVRMEDVDVGDNGLQVLQLARELSNSTRLPVTYHIGNTSPDLSVILASAQPGDIITHCYHPLPGGILDAGGKVLPEVIAAAERGVHFDVGHGVSSFSFQVARKAMDQGLLAGTISSDLHIKNIDGPVYDLTTTMSKFLYLGLTINEVIEMTTWKPAQLLRLHDQRGALQSGYCADLTLLKLCHEPIPLTGGSVNAVLETITAEQYLTAYGVIRAGQVIFCGSDTSSQA